MEIIVSRENLLPILNRIIPVVERRQTIPILGNLLLQAYEESLTIIGTDLEIEIKSLCPSDVIDSGDGTIPARKFGDICRSLMEGSEIRIKISNERCILTAGRGRYVLGTLPANDFPTMESLNPKVKIEIEEGVLRRMLDKTAFAMAQQDVRYYLNGLLFQADNTGLRVVATDGHRLASYFHSCQLQLQDIYSIIIPFKTVTELRRQLSYVNNTVLVEFSERIIRISFQGTVSSSKLIDGRYPEYERVIPAGLMKVATTNREILKKALSRAAILSNEKYRGLRVIFESGVLRLIAHNPEQEEAVEEMELNYNGETTVIGYNVSYLSDLLGAIDSTEVEVHFNDGNSSSLWRGVGETGEIYVVMPMRL